MSTLAPHLGRATRKRSALGSKRSRDPEDVLDLLEEHMIDYNTFIADRGAPSEIARVVLEELAERAS